MEPKLRVVIHLDIDADRVRVEIHGRVTERNCNVLYVLAKRANAAFPTLGVVMDLSQASICDSALAGLYRSSETGQFPVLAYTGLAPKQMSVLAPAA